MKSSVLNTVVELLIISSIFLAISCEEQEEHRNYFKYNVVDGINFNCSTFKYSNPSVDVKNAYDNFFADNRPKGEGGFGWAKDDAVLNTEVLDTIKFNGLPTGLDDQLYHDYFDFNPNKYSRTTKKSNLDIFKNLNLSDRYAPFKNYNPLDWIPTTATYYSRSEYNDVMAVQFMFRRCCYNDQIEEGLRRCPDCADAITALSCNDMYKIFEVRFVKAENNVVKLSKPFKFVVVDCSGHMFNHATEGAVYQFAKINNNWYMKDRRFEISGWFHQQIQTMTGVGGAQPLVARLWDESFETPAPTPEPTTNPSPEPTETPIYNTTETTGTSSNSTYSTSVYTSTSETSSTNSSTSGSPYGAELPGQSNSSDQTILNSESEDETFVGGCGLIRK